MLLRPLLLLLVYLSLAFAVTPAQAAQVQLAWDAPLQANGAPIPNLAGYRLYYGLQKGQYHTKISVGIATTYTVTNLSPGQTYYFAVKPYDSTGTESTFLSEWRVKVESGTIYVQNMQSGKDYTSQENTKELGAPSQSFPDWAPVAGGVSGGLTLLFFMGVVIMAIFGREVPPTSRFPVIAVLALGFAMTAAFVGGNAAANGNLPVPGLEDKPVQFSIAGGIAVFIIVLFVGNILYPKQSPTIKIASDKPIIPDDFRKKVYDDVKNFITACTLRNVQITRAMRIILKNHHTSSDINFYIKDHIGEILDKEEQLKEAKELEDETKQTELRAWFRQQLYSLDEKFNV